MQRQEWDKHKFLSDCVLLKHSSPSFGYTRPTINTETPKLALKSCSFFVVMKICFVQILDISDQIHN